MSNDTIKVQTPLTKLKDDYELRLAEKEAENLRLRLELHRLREERGQVVAVVDLLRLQIVDLLYHLRAHRQQIDIVEHNLTSLQQKLPEG